MSKGTWMPICLPINFETVLLKLLLFTCGRFGLLSTTLPTYVVSFYGRLHASAN